MNITYLKGALLILAATFCFAFQPIFGTFAYDDGTGVVALLWLRFSFAVLLLHGYRLCRAASRSSVSARNPLLLGIVLALTSVCYFSALRYISIGLTTLLFYLFPLYIYLLSIALRRERFSAVKTAAIAVALGGVYIGAGDLGSLPLLGLVLGLSAGAGYASYISLSGHFLAGQGTLHVLTWVSTGAFAVLSVILPFTQVALPQTSQGYLAALGLCAVCTLISLALLLKGTRLVQRTTDISVMVMLEIGSTLLLVQLLLDTQIQPYEWAGALMVFSAAVTVFVYGSRQRPVT